MDSFNMPTHALTREQAERLDEWIKEYKKPSDETSVNALDYVRWLQTCPDGMVIVQGRPALAGNEIEWTDAVRRSKVWCKANPVDENDDDQ